MSPAGTPEPSDLSKLNLKSASVQQPSSPYNDPLLFVIPRACELIPFSAGASGSTHVLVVVGLLWGNRARVRFSRLDLAYGAGFLLFCC